MNKERLRYLADVIENQTLPNVEFDMTTFGEVRYASLNDERREAPCGTACCIAGTAWILAGGSIKMMAAMDQDDLAIAVKTTARDWLGLTGEEANELFIPDYVSLAIIGKNRAVRVLRNAAETGVIAW